MLLYLFNYLSIPLYGAFIKKKRTLVVLLSLQIFLILALRQETLGVDLDNYSQYFYYYKPYSLVEMIRAFRVVGGSKVGWRLEWGYVFLNWVVVKLGFGFHSFLVLHAAICTTSTGIFIYRYSKNPSLSMAMFCALGGFVYYFGILRQSLALAMIFFAIPSILKKRPVRFFGWVLLGLLFHYTAVLVIPLYFIGRIPVKKIYYPLAVFACGAVTLLTPFGFRYVLSPLLTMLGKPYEMSAFSLNSTFLILLLITVMFALFYQKTGAADSIFAWALLLGLNVQAVAFYMPVLSRAVIGIFMMLLTPLVPNYLSRLKSRQMALCVSIAIYAVGLILYIRTVQTSDILPYVAVWTRS